jgi:hypothetical protein
VSSKDCPPSEVIPSSPSIFVCTEGISDGKSEPEGKMEGMADGK